MLYGNLLKQLCSKVMPLFYLNHIVYVHSMISMDHSLSIKTDHTTKELLLKGKAQYD